MELIDHYIINCYKTVIDEYITDKNYEDALEAIDHLAEFYIQSTMEAVEKKDWE